MIIVSRRGKNTVKKNSVSWAERKGFPQQKPREMIRVFEIEINESYYHVSPYKEIQNANCFTSKVLIRGLGRELRLFSSKTEYSCEYPDPASYDDISVLAR